MQEDILMSAVCGLLALVALGVAVWAIFTGQVGEQGLDGIFLLLVCGLFALVFGMIPLQSLRHGRLGALLKRKEAGEAAPAPAHKAGEKA